MHELTGQIDGVSISYITGKHLVTLELNEKEKASLMINELLSEDKLSIKIDKYREKRSLNANNYAWALITKIGDAIRMSKEEAYMLMLHRYGQSEMISVKDYVSVPQYIKYCREVGESELNGTLFKHWVVYKGSSEFDTKEMSIFIDGIVSEAQALGIPTETPDQIAKLKSLWKEGEQK